MIVRIFERLIFDGDGEWKNEVVSGCVIYNAVDAASDQDPSVKHFVSVFKHLDPDANHGQRLSLLERHAIFSNFKEGTRVCVCSNVVHIPST